MYVIDVNSEPVLICHRPKMDDSVAPVPICLIPPAVFIVIRALSFTEDHQSGYACPMGNGVERNQGERLFQTSLILCTFALTPPRFFRKSVCIFGSFRASFVTDLSSLSFFDTVRATIPYFQMHPKKVSNVTGTS